MKDKDLVRKFVSESLLNEFLPPMPAGAGRDPLGDPKLVQLFSAFVSHPQVKRIIDAKHPGVIDRMRKLALKSWEHDKKQGKASGTFQMGQMLKDRRDFFSQHLPEFDGLMSMIASLWASKHKDKAEKPQSLDSLGLKGGPQGE